MMEFSAEGQAAIISGIVSAIGFIVTMIITSRTLRNEKAKMAFERERLDNDRRRLDVEIEKIKAETDKINIDAYDIRNVQQAEVEKVRAEQKKIELEMKEIRNVHRRVDADKLRELLLLFERAAFDSPRNQERPDLLFIAIRETRINMQKMGATLLYDSEISKKFSLIRKCIMNIEEEVDKRYPYFSEIVSQDYTKNNYDLIRKSLTGNAFLDILTLMLSIRSEIEPHLKEIQAELISIERKLRDDLS